MLRHDSRPGEGILGMRVPLSIEPLDVAILLLGDRGAPIQLTPIYLDRMDG